MPKDPMEMNSVELKQLRATLPEDTAPSDMAALNDRIVEVLAEEKAEAVLAKREKLQKGEEYDAKAKKRWPALNDKESDFRKAVVAEMERRGDDPLDERAMYDAANDVGAQLGRVPEGWKPADETLKIMGIKPGSEQDGNGEGGDKPYTEKRPDLLQGLINAGHIKADDEEAIARINANAEAMNNG